MRPSLRRHRSCRSVSSGSVSSRPRRIAAVLALGVAVALLAPPPAGSAPGPVLAARPAPADLAPPGTVTGTPAAPRGRVARTFGPMRVHVLSNRADLLSGGDALVEVSIPRRVRPASIRVRAGGRDVTRAFAVRPDGRFVGLVRGLRVGRTAIVATSPGRRARVVVTNHPRGGPVFSGPQTRHYRCQDTARDRRCNEPTRYAFLYKSSNPLRPGLRPYDPSSPPSDVATTTTDQGVRVPFVVRQETGYQNRDRYTILTLWRPGQRWRPWAPQRQWNRKLLITHGGGCGASYAPADPPLADYSGTFDAIPVNPVENSYVTALGRGFAVMSAALANTGHNCNAVLNAESVMMAKERLVERYGELRYTIGTGCSGGSIAQHTSANSYPGLYQGLITTCSYPDVFTAGAQFADYHLLRLYFENPTRWGPGVVWSPHQWAAVEGHLSHLNAVVADEGLFKSALNPQHPCSGTVDTRPGDPSTRYHPTTNPRGVRCSVLDLVINQLGPRAKAVWSAAERRAGRGFGGIPFSNTGVLYGLNALRNGVITTEQFVDLNVKIGGLDVDSRRTDARIRGDRPAIRRAYRTGLVNTMTNMREVAIINHGGPDPGIAHDYAHAFWTEERLQRAQGHTGNRVMWFGPAPLIGDLTWATEALVEMDRWLGEIETDPSTIPLARKVRINKPRTLQDRCVAPTGLQIVCATRQLDLLQTRLSTPRQEAGGPTANDVVACRLRPLRRGDFAFLPLGLTDDQWRRLSAVFAGGVCDWSRRGVGQGPATTWLTYAGKRGGVAYGGRPLPRPGVGTARGTASVNFLEAYRRR